MPITRDEALSLRKNANAETLSRVTPIIDAKLAKYNGLSVYVKLPGLDEELYELVAPVYRELGWTVKYEYDVRGESDEVWLAFS